jgi:SRSO17 transposase
VSLQGLERKLSRANVERHLFLHQFEEDLTHRADGSSWARHEDTYRTAAHYLEGLLTPGPRKSMRNLAKRAAIDKDRVERFVRESPWEPEAVQGHLRRHIPKAIRDRKAVIVIDDFGIAKQGVNSVGVARQYSGVLGKTGNCQVAVNLTYAAPGSRKRNADQRTWPLGVELYLPQAWVESPEYAKRRDDVHLPEGTVFRTKHEIALDLLEKAWTAGVVAYAVVSDAEYGTDSRLRERLRQRGDRYVMGINPSSVRFIDPDIPVSAPGRNGVVHYPEGTRVETARQIAQRIEVWRTVLWGQGTKGPLRARFALVRVRVVERATRERRATDEIAGLLLELRGDQLKAHLCWGFDRATLAELARIAHMRWTIEQYHKEAKQLLGMDRFEGRTWKGWHRHMAIVLLAYAFLATLRVEMGGGAPLPPLRQVARVLVTEATAQEILRHHRLRKEQARAVAGTSVRYLTDL